MAIKNITSLDDHPKLKALMIQVQRNIHDGDFESAFGWIRECEDYLVDQIGNDDTYYGPDMELERKFAYLNEMNYLSSDFVELHTLGDAVESAGNYDELNVRTMYGWLLRTVDGFLAEHEYAVTVDHARMTRRQEFQSAVTPTRNVNTQQTRPTAPQTNTQTAPRPPIQQTQNNTVRQNASVNQNGTQQPQNQGGKNNTVIIVVAVILGIIIIAILRAAMLNMYSSIGYGGGLGSALGGLVVLGIIIAAVVLIVRNRKGKGGKK